MDEEDIADENSEESDGKINDNNASQSENDEAVSDEVSDGGEAENKNNEGDAPSSSSPDVRKRRSRKAD